ncbi:hypothetical protein EDM60_26555 [Brevibacillus parabrevis]|nr:hypothetical protein EDM60_26555 [Brevibacillus parabrevis]
MDAHNIPSFHVLICENQSQNEKERVCREFCIEKSENYAWKSVNETDSSRQMLVLPLFLIGIRVAIGKAQKEGGEWL